MRATSVMRFVIFGAVGFGIGGAIGFVAFLLIPVGGAVGGASLGLALKDRRRAVILALLGALGLSVGILATLTFASLLNYAWGPMGAIVGAAVGASLGVAFWDWSRFVVLAVVGSVGFGVGMLAGNLLPWDSLPSVVVRFGLGISIVVAGAIGGASLGATLGYLEKRKLAAQQRPVVR